MYVCMYACWCVLASFFFFFFFFRSGVGHWGGCWVGTSIVSYGFKCVIIYQV